MKKLILSAAIVLGGLTAATAQTDKEQTALNQQKQTTVEAQVENRLDAAQDVDATQDADATVATEATVVTETEAVNADVVTTTVATVAVQDYKEVKVSEVPQTVQDALTKDFNGATISKAYVNAQGEYKLDLATADKKAATVYADAKGQWIKNEMKKQ